MAEVIPGIYRLEVPIPNNPLGHTNVYLLAGDSYLLIDAGWDNEKAFQSLKRQLAEIGIGIEDISRIIVTHTHRDHYGLASRLKQLSRAEIMAHHLEKTLIQTRYTDLADPFRQTEEWLHTNGTPANGMPLPQTALASVRNFGDFAPPDTVFHGGETITNGSFTLQVLWTPGHSPGHICLYEPTQKILFSGDHVLPVITPNVSLRPESDINPLGRFLNSINLVKDLDVNLVLPAHQHPFTNLRARAEEIIRHHQQRNSEILATIKTEPKTAYQISTEITWMPQLGGVSWQKLAPWDRRLAVLETLAHLEALRVDGGVNKLRRDSIIYYQPARYEKIVSLKIRLSKSKGGM